MADEVTNVTTNTEDGIEAIDIDALKAENEQKDAMLKKYKASIDKLTKEAAERKREERAKMTEEEKVRAEQAEEFERKFTHYEKSYQHHPRYYDTRRPYDPRICQCCSSTRCQHDHVCSLH